MSDFFHSLELELRSAAERRPRRLAGWGRRVRGAAAALVVTAVLAAALVPALLLMGRDADRQTGEPSHSDQAVAQVGTVIPKGEGTPPRRADSTVVATGRAPVAGPWQLEVTRSTGLKDPKTGEVYEPKGLPCLSIHPLNPPRGTPPLSGQCGLFPRTPGFSRVELTVPYTGRGPDGSPRRASEILVYGRAPERASAIVITGDRGVRITVRPKPGPTSVRGKFYVIPVKPALRGGRINWLDSGGNQGSRGIGLLPPVGR